MRKFSMPALFVAAALLCAGPARASTRLLETGSTLLYNRLSA